MILNEKQQTAVAAIQAAAMADSFKVAKDIAREYFPADNICMRCGVVKPKLNALVSYFHQDGILTFCLKCINARVAEFAAQIKINR